MEKGEFDTVILTVPLRGARIEQALSQLRSLAPGRQPTYLALVPPDFASERVRDLYARGARLVLAWPDDVSHLDEWLNLAAGPSDALRAGDTERIEQRLERAVRERLRLRLRRFAKGLAVEARSGVARLSGRVGSLWAKRAVERHAAASPGVRDVDAHRLEVEASSRTDASIGQEIRALLDGTSSIDASTLGVSVHAGRVVLIGALLNVERDHVLELISMVPGVRSLVDASSPSALRKWRDRRRARRLAHKLRTRVSGADLRVAVVGSTAVLRGVGSTREIHDATAALDQLVQSSRSLRTALHRASWTRPAAG
ncbi:MAG: BON domain-containing protein [Myxococcota bacterium]